MIFPISQINEWTGNEVEGFGFEWYVAVEFAAGTIYGVNGNYEYEAMDDVNGLFANLQGLSQ